MRPIKTRRFAPAVAKAIAVSRPMPLPLMYDLSVLVKTQRGAEARPTAPVMMTVFPALLSSARFGEIAA